MELSIKLSIFADWSDSFESLLLGCEPSLVNSW